MFLGLALSVSGGAQHNQNWPVGGDIPADFEPVAAQAEFERRILMIPMRDGVKLKTVLMLPSGVQDAPIILDRTPYNAERYATMGGRSPSVDAHMLPFHGDLAKAGYIVALQDVRGKYGSEGEYVMTRPLAGPLNPTGIDHSTDAYDTIEWLIKNVPETNGRVGTTGISYDGFTALMSLVDPHPALKASVPIDPMVDGWVGDDWFHNGAYRQTFQEFIYIQSTSKASSLRWPDPRYDVYESWLEAGSAGAMAARYNVDKLPFWQRIANNPAYTSFWSQQALDKILAARPLRVPVLLVHAQWDQEDIYGAPAVYAALKPKDSSNNKVFLAMGPWNHGGAVMGSGATLGPLAFGSETGAWFRRNVMLPFLDGHLKGEGEGADIATVTSFVTGPNEWRHYARWPLSCEKNCPHRSQPLYLRAGGRLSFDRPDAGDAPFSEYLSDPAKPVTYRARPILATNVPGSTWSLWLADDQRFASVRPDVLTYVSDELTEPMQIAGQPIAHLFASTSGEDSDWVVKLIDVYPDEVPGDPGMGGYQFGISMEILRGRYRDNASNPSPIPSGKVVRYNLKMPDADHVFMKGHRIMVQIQSSWFPLYDRNPQSYVDNIMFAKPQDYVKATQRVFHRPQAESYLELPLVPPSAHR
jgi:putative CocE/NonD family hydrolase